jgi:murein DD-endopeptidase MepM/ murein hydrolase activator NlpD
MKRILIAGVSTGAVLPLTACGNTNHYSHTSATSAAWGMPGVSGMSISRTGGGTPAPLISNTAPSSAQHSAADTMFAAQQQPQPNPGPPVSAPIDGAWALPLPTASYYISTCFCMRWGEFHAGDDLAAGYGTPIYSVGAGIVAASGPAQGFGNWA